MEWKELEQELRPQNVKIKGPISTATIERPLGWMTKDELKKELEGIYKENSLRIFIEAVNKTIM